MGAAGGTLRESLAKRAWSPGPGLLLRAGQPGQRSRTLRWLGRAPGSGERSWPGCPSPSRDARFAGWAGAALRPASPGVPATRAFQSHYARHPSGPIAVSRNLLLVLNCGCRLRGRPRDQPPAAAKVPRVTGGSRPWCSRSSHYPAEPVTAGRGFAGPGTLARGLPARSGDTMNASRPTAAGRPGMGSGRGILSPERRAGRGRTRFPGRHHARRRQRCQY